MNKNDQINTYCEMVTHIITTLNPEVPHDIIIDSPPVDAIEGLIKLYNELCEDGFKIEWFEVRPSSEDHILQVHDFITGAVGDRVEGIIEKDDLYNIIKDKEVGCPTIK